MKSTFKKFLVFTLSLVMVLSAVPVSVFAYVPDPISYYRMDVDYNEAMTAGYSNSDMGITGDCTVSRHIGASTYTAIVATEASADIRLSNTYVEEKLVISATAISDDVYLTLEGYNKVNGNIEVKGHLVIQGSGYLDCDNIEARSITVQSGYLNADKINVTGQNLVVYGGYIDASVVKVANKYYQNGGYVNIDNTQYSMYVDGSSTRFAALHTDLFEQEGGYLRVNNKLSFSTANDYSVYGIYVYSTFSQSYDYAVKITGGYTSVSAVINTSATGTVNDNHKNTAAGMYVNYSDQGVYVTGGILEAYAAATIGYTAADGKNAYVYSYPIYGTVRDTLDPTADSSPIMWQKKDGNLPVDLAKDTYDFRKTLEEYNCDGSWSGHENISTSCSRNVVLAKHFTELGNITLEESATLVNGTWISNGLANEYIIKDSYVTDSSLATISAVRGTVVIDDDFTVASGCALVGDGSKATVIINGDLTLEDDVTNVDLFVKGNIYLTNGAIISGNAIALEGISVTGNATVEEGSLVTVLNGLVVNSNSDFTIAGNVSAIGFSEYGIALKSNAHILAGIKAGKEAGKLNNGIITIYSDNEAVDGASGYGTINGMANAWIGLVRYNNYDSLYDGYERVLAHLADEVHSTIDSYSKYLSVGEYRRSIYYNYVNTGLDSSEVIDGSSQFWIYTGSSSYYEPYEWHTTSRSYKTARFELGYYPTWVEDEQITYDNADYISGVGASASAFYKQASSETVYARLVLDETIEDGLTFDTNTVENPSNSNYFKYRRMGLEAPIVSQEILAVEYFGEVTVNADTVSGKDISSYGIYGYYPLILLGTEGAILNAKGSKVEQDTQYGDANLERLVSAGIGSASIAIIEYGTVNATGGQAARGYSAGIYCNETYDGFNVIGNLMTGNVLLVEFAELNVKGDKQLDDSNLKVSSGINAEELAVYYSTINAIALNGKQGTGIFVSEDAEIISSTIEIEALSEGIVIGTLDGDDADIGISGSSITVKAVDGIVVQNEDAEIYYSTIVAIANGGDAIRVYDDLVIEYSYLEAEAKKNISSYDNYAIYAGDRTLILGSTANVLGKDYAVKVENEFDVIDSFVNAEALNGVGIKTEKLKINETSVYMPYNIPIVVPERKTLINVTGSSFGVEAEKIIFISEEDSFDTQIGLLNVVATGDNGHAIKTMAKESESEYGIEMSGHMSMIKAVSSGSAIVGSINMGDGYIYATSSDKAIEFTVSNPAINSGAAVFSFGEGYKLFGSSDKKYDKELTEWIPIRNDNIWIYRSMYDVDSDCASFPIVTSALTEEPNAKTAEIFFPATAKVETGHTAHYVLGIEETLDAPLKDTYYLNGEAVQATPYEFMEKFIELGEDFVVATPQAAYLDKWFTYDNFQGIGTEPTHYSNNYCYWADEEDGPGYTPVYFTQAYDYVGSEYTGPAFTVAKNDAVQDRQLVKALWKNEYDNYVVTKPLTSFNNLEAYGITVSGSTLTLNNATIDLEHHEAYYDYAALALGSIDKIVLVGDNKIINGFDYCSAAISGSSITLSGSGNIYIDSGENGIYGNNVTIDGTGNVIIDSCPKGINASGDVVVSGSGLLTIKEVGGEGIVANNATFKGTRTTDISAEYHGIYCNNKLTVESGIVNVLANDYVAIYASDASIAASINVVGSSTTNGALSNYHFCKADGTNLKKFVKDETVGTSCSAITEAKKLMFSNVYVQSVSVSDGNGSSLSLNTGNAQIVKNLTATVAPTGANKSVNWTASTGLTLTNDTKTTVTVTIPANMSAGTYYVWADTVGLTSGNQSKRATYTITVTAPYSPGPSGYIGGSSYVAPVKEEPKKVETVWTDVRTGRYYTEAMQWCYENNIMDPTSSTKFGINEVASRAQLIVALYRANGSPKVSASATIPFTDVKKTDSCYDAVVWAYTNKYIEGATATTFNPSGVLCRADIVTLLWNFDGKKVEEGTIDFTDVKVNSYYEKAVDWSTAKGLVDGKTATTFAPKEDLVKQDTIVLYYRYFVKGLND